MPANALLRGRRTFKLWSSAHGGQIRLSPPTRYRYEPVYLAAVHVVFYVLFMGMDRADDGAHDRTPHETKDRG